MSREGLTNDRCVSRLRLSKGVREADRSGMMCICLLNRLLIVRMGFTRRIPEMSVSSRWMVGSGIRRYRMSSMHFSIATTEKAQLFELAGQRQLKEIETK